MKNRTLVNTVSNLASRMWTMVANFLFVPLYIKFLGSEAYGLVTFFATLQTALNLLGLGLSKTLRREFAADETKGKDKLYKYQIMRSVEAVYFAIAIIIVFLCYFGSTFISSTWLTVESISTEIVATTIFLMGVSIAIQLIANLYLGCLFGLEMQVKANCFQIGWSVVKNFGVVLIIAFINADICVFYTWHCVIDFLYLILLRYAVIRYLKSSSDKLYWTLKNLSNLRMIYRFAGGVMLISIGYAINTQIDKIIISGKFNLTQVGAYNTAYNLGYIVAAVSAAVGIVVFSRFSKLYSQGNADELKKSFNGINKRTNIIICTTGAFVAVFSRELIILWTGSVEIAEMVNMAAPLIIIGTVLSAAQEIPYDYFLSCGVTVVNTVQTILCILYVLLVTPQLIRIRGLTGAGMAWLIEMFIATTVYLYVFYRKYYKGEEFKRIIIDLYFPLIGSIFIALGLKKYIFITMDPLMTIIMAILSGIVILLLWFWLYDKESLRSGLEKIKGRKKNEK